MTRSRSYTLWLFWILVQPCDAQTFRELPFRGPQRNPGPWNPNLIVLNSAFIENQGYPYNESIRAALSRRFDSGYYDGPSAQEFSGQDTAGETRMISTFINAARYAISFPKTCAFNGERYACRFGLSCWLRSGRSVDLCDGGDVWTCCIPPEKSTKDLGENVIKNPASHLGEQDRKYATEPYIHEDHLVRRKMIHENFNRKLIAQDIALLELATPVKFRKHIVPICLPRRGETFAGEFATVSGWGLVDAERKVMPALLQKVDVNVLKNDDCRSWLSEHRRDTLIRNNVLCAGFEDGGKDSCRGDSGGPLYLKRGGRAQIIGIVSWGLKCTRAKAPGVYTRVSEYVNWIPSHINISHTAPQSAPPYFAPENVDSSVDSNHLESPPKED